MDDSLEINDSLEIDQNLPLRASGEFLGNRWEFHGDVVGDSARQWILLLGPDVYRESGGIGPLPFADVGWKTFGHIGGYGWSGGWSRKGIKRIYQPGSVSGVIAQQVAKVVIFFKNGASEEALVIESGHPDVNFFFLTHQRRERWTEIVAFDAQGEELDRVEPF